MWPLGFGSPTERTSLLLVRTVDESKYILEIMIIQLSLPNKTVPTNITLILFQL